MPGVGPVHSAHRMWTKLAPNLDFFQHSQAQPLLYSAPFQVILCSQGEKSATKEASKVPRLKRFHNKQTQYLDDGGMPRVGWGRDDKNQSRLFSS